MVQLVRILVENIKKCAKMINIAQQDDIMTSV